MSDATGKGGAGPKRPRWVTFLLFGSLALNMFLIGVVTTGIVVGSKVGEVAKEHGGPGHLVRRVMRTLPREDRRALRREMRDVRPQFRAIMDARPELHEDIADAVAADPFDVEALRDAFARLRESNLQAMALGQNLIADFAESLTPEQRAEIADELLRRPKHDRDRPRADGPPTDLRSPPRPPE